MYGHVVWKPGICGVVQARKKLISLEVRVGKVNNCVYKLRNF